MHKTITLHPGDTLLIECKDKTIKSTKKKIKTKSTEFKVVPSVKKNDNLSPFMRANLMFREKSRISEKRKKDRIKNKNNEIANLREQLSQSKQLAMIPHIPHSNNACEPPETKQIKLNKFTILPLINNATRTRFL
jgi:hypothetical protein